MSLKELIADDAANVFFNTDEFGEPATYNEVEITVIPKIGEGQTSKKPFENANRYETAYFAVMATDVPNPETGDVLVHNGKEWQFATIAETDGIIHTLRFTGNESAILLK
jgi:hypothetical protein